MLQYAVSIAAFIAETINGCQEFFAGIFSRASVVNSMGVPWRFSGLVHLKL
jgi:hypothetical protein